jgi:flavin reductase (DIM6/NTAB) family NADH-FMN oxidoreductase RutF
MYSVEPKELELRKRHGFLLGGIAPRPIAFVSTISKDGVNNLAPFSFFNAFGANPPTIAFSPARRGRDNTTKDTYQNLLDTGECVVHAVTFDIVEQMNLASSEFAADVDEFLKAGFTPLDSHLVKPKRVKESPFHMECKLIDMVEMGGGAGSGNFAICEVIKYHISEDIMTDGHIDPYKIDLVGRNGGNYYTRANGDALFEIAKPGLSIGMGYDKLPDYIKKSDVYTANDLGKIAMQLELPPLEEVKTRIEQIDLLDAEPEMFDRHARLGDYEMMLKIALSLHKKGDSRKILFERTAKLALDFDDLDFALDVVVYTGNEF